MYKEFASTLNWDTTANLSPITKLVQTEVTISKLRNSTTQDKAASALL